jgi:protein phosphatase
VIRRYLGSPTPPEVDLRLRLREDEDDAQAEANQGIQLLPGDLVLLTSDGLTDLVNDTEIQDSYQIQTGSVKSSLEDAGRRLIDLANERGGHDNITLVAVSVPMKKPAGARLQRWIGRYGVWLGGCLGLFLVLLIATGFAGGWWWANRTPDPLLIATRNPLQPSAAVTAVPPTMTQPAEAKPTRASSFLTPTPTPASLLPADSGATLTPWPTNTPGK